MTKIAIWEDGTTSDKTTNSDNFTVGFRFIVNGTSLEFFAKDEKTAHKRFENESSYIKTALSFKRTDEDIKSYYSSDKYQKDLDLEKQAKETFEIVNLVEKIQ